MTHNRSEAGKEKNFVAGSSVLAAIFLTGSKLVIGLLTNSLGILSEALHSFLDLIAAVITMVAVRFSDKPADDDHNYGHGKIENFSALVETILLVITCVWIIYEAVARFLSNQMHIEVTVWSYIVVIGSIIIDISRSRALMRVAKKYDSQALEADALHFQTDIWSSLVVLIGLIGYDFKYFYADSIAAVFVAFIVLGVSYRLGKRTFDDLVDKAPRGLTAKIAEALKNVPEVTRFHDIRVRVSGPNKFIELNIHVGRMLSIEEAHNISHLAESAIVSLISNAKVTVHVEPELGD